VPFSLDGPGGFLAALRRRLAERAHAVIVPIGLLASQQRRLDPVDPQWQAVLACTGQPARFG
jgi:hypothetical protein